MVNPTKIASTATTIGKGVKNALPTVGHIALGAGLTVGTLLTLGMAEVYKQSGEPVSQMPKDFVGAVARTGQDLAERRAAAKPAKAEAKATRKAAKEQKAEAKVTKAEAKVTRRSGKTAKAEVRAAQKAARANDGHVNWWAEWFKNLGLACEVSEAERAEHAERVEARQAEKAFRAEQREQRHQQRIVDSAIAKIKAGQAERAAAEQQAKEVAEVATAAAATADDEIARIRAHNDATEAAIRDGYDHRQAQQPGCESFGPGFGPESIAACREYVKRRAESIQSQNPEGETMTNKSKVEAEQPSDGCENDHIPAFFRIPSPCIGSGYRRVPPQSSDGPQADQAADDQQATQA